jgi:hypothetical protein
MLVLAAILALATGAPPPSNDQPLQVRHLRLWQVPDQVRRDLLAFTRRCELSNPRKYARIDAGPFGGPGRTDYLFQSNGPYWRVPIGKAFHEAQRCEIGQFVYQTLFWMQTDGRYRLVSADNAYVFVRRSQVMIQMSPRALCGTARIPPTGDCRAFTVWDATAERFIPVSGPMPEATADAWAKHQGYDYYEFQLDGKDTPTPMPVRR